MEENLWSLVSRTVNQSGGIEKAVFFLLLGFSLISWCLMFVKSYDIYVARRNGQRFLQLFDGADRFGSILNTVHTVGLSPLVNIFKAGMTVLENRRAATGPVVSDPRQISVNPESSPEDLSLMSMQHTAASEFGRLQKGLGFLATIGSTSPFIGLFGTVWGIMHTFRDLSNMKSASIAVVAPGISASLIATAAGLAVAIPAVMAYNLLLAQIEELEDQADTFIERVSALVRASGVMATSPAQSQHSATPHPSPAHPAPAAHPAPINVTGQFVPHAQPAANPAPVSPAPTTLGAK
jgi:biopolymer transport protein TolQ